MGGAVAVAKRAWVQHAGRDSARGPPIPSQCEIASIAHLVGFLGGHFIRHSVRVTRQRVNVMRRRRLAEVESSSSSRKAGRTELEMTLNVVNMVVSGQRAAGVSVSQTAAGLLAFSQHHDHWVYREGLPKEKILRLALVAWNKNCTS